MLFQSICAADSQSCKAGKASPLARSQACAFFRKTGIWSASTPNAFTSSGTTSITTAVRMARISTSETRIHMGRRRAFSAFLSVSGQNFFSSARMGTFNTKAMQKPRKNGNVSLAHRRTAFHSNSQWSSAQ